MKILAGKKILIVDDEPDVIEALKDLLDMCTIDTATDFRTAKKLLNQKKYEVEKRHGPFDDLEWF